MGIPRLSANIYLIDKDPGTRSIHDNAYQNIRNLEKCSNKHTQLYSSTKLVKKIQIESIQTENNRNLYHKSKDDNINTMIHRIL